MDDNDIRCILEKCESRISMCSEYKRLEIQIIKAETEIKKQLDGELLHLFNKFNDMVNRQELIYIDNLVECIKK
jgi:hypothetical protein